MKKLATNFPRPFNAACEYYAARVINQGHSEGVAGESGVVEREKKRGEANRVGVKGAAPGEIVSRPARRKVPGKQ